MANTLVSGKLGDLFHSLYIPYSHYCKTGEQCVVYITDKIEAFERGLEATYQELQEVLSAQSWCKEFSIWRGESIKYDTTKFRTHRLINKGCWSEMMTEVAFGNVAPLRGGWITWEVPKKYPYRIVINRRPKNPLPAQVARKYRALFRRYEEVVFLGSEEDYAQFPLRAFCRLVVPQTIGEWLTHIAESGYFIGNQSAPLAMASALDVKRLGELLPPTEEQTYWRHYFDETKYGQIDVINAPFFHTLIACVKNICLKDI